MARDIIHVAVKKALEKDNWQITNDPFYLESGGVQVEIDLAAEKFTELSALCRNCNLRTKQVNL